MKSAGAVFHQIMEKIISDLQPRCVLIYKDNITVYSKLIQQNLADLDAVFARLEAANFKTSFSKTRLSQTEDFVLGHTFSAASIRPHPHQVEAITKKEAPSSAEEVGRVLSAVIFFPAGSSQAAPPWLTSSSSSSKDAYPFGGRPLSKPPSPASWKCCHPPRCSVS